jgi:hypothetical protein
MIGPGIVLAGIRVVPLQMPPFVSGVSITEGISNKPYISIRQSFIQQLLKRVMDFGIVLIKAPPQAGKTSTLQLAAMQMGWLQEEYPSFRMEVYVVTMLGHATLDDAVRKQHPMFQGGWHDIMASPPTSCAGEHFNVFSLVVPYMHANSLLTNPSNCWTDTTNASPRAA